MSFNEFFANMRASARAEATSLFFAYGEVSAYDPATHSAKFLLPQHPQTAAGSNQGQPMETGFIQLGSQYTGPGVGAQFPPPLNAQALIAFLDQNFELPVSTCFMYNDVENPPFPDGKSRGWVDEKGNSFTTSQDGPSANDGVGAARVNGAKYVQHTTDGGHAITMDDVHQILEHYSAGGHVFALDDVLQQVRTITTGGHQQIMDDINKVMFIKSALGHKLTLSDLPGAVHAVLQTTGGHQAVLDDIANAINFIPASGGKMGLGAAFASLADAQGIINKTILDTLGTNVNSANLQTLINLATAMGPSGANIPNASALLPLIVASLIHSVAVPLGSATVRAVS